MKVFETTDIPRLDAGTIEAQGISSHDLMERAACEMTQTVMQLWPECDTDIVVFAGPGNNGGDALAMARMLKDNGYEPHVYLFNTTGKLSDDCRRNKELLQVMPDADFTEVVRQFEPPRLDTESVVIDGLFGSGLSRPLTGGFASVVRYINASKAQVVAIDIPSGLMGEDNSHNVMQHVVKADFTLTIQQPKLSFLFAENSPYLGEWHAVDIGLDEDVMESVYTDYTLVDKGDLAPLIKPRDKFAHKGSFGKALLVAGSRGMAGASVLAARAALKSGLGLLTVHVPGGNNGIVQTAVPEAMTSIDADDACFTTVPDLEGYKALGVGPGLGTDDQTATALAELLGQCKVPVVIDADAINLIARHTVLLHRLPKGCVLTPHPGEFDRLVGASDNSYQRLSKARELSAQTGAVIVLKGAYTAVITPDGRCSFNTTGNPGMATAGSGDVLTGVILSLLAQGLQPEDAARLGVYVHGLAGDVAAHRLGETGMTAQDLVASLPAAWKFMSK